VDQNGYAHLPLRPGARRIFVDAISGADANSCDAAQSPSAPKATIGAGASCIQNLAGAGDQLLIAEATTYAEGLPNLSYKYGFSAVYPTVIQSYDPIDPLNEGKYGKASGTRRPVVNTSATQGALTSAQPTALMPNYSHFAFRGLDWNPGDRPSQTLNMIGGNSYVLFENNVFRYTQLVLDYGEGYGNRAVKHIVRKNAFYGSWASSGHAQGFYDAGTDGITIEDNVFWHNGWKLGASRDDGPSAGGPTMFRHSIYTQTDTSALVRRNVFADPAATGASVRGDVTLSENVFLDNPMAIFAGVGNDYNFSRPNGVNIEIGRNLILGDADINSANPRGQAINTANGRAGSSAHNNVILRSRNPYAVNAMAFYNSALYNQPSYMTFSKNLVYRYSPVVSGNGGNYPAQVITSFVENYWDAAPTGTNVSSSNMYFPNPLTATDMYSMMGCGSKDVCVAQMIASPEGNWAPRMREIMFKAYGRTYP
jgi:hypothetical protein